MNQHKPYITTSYGISGYFALCMSWDEEEKMYLPDHTGIGRYHHRYQAEVEAREWAASEELKFKP